MVQRPLITSSITASVSSELSPPFSSRLRAENNPIPRCYLELATSCRSKLSRTPALKTTIMRAQVDLHSMALVCFRLPSLSLPILLFAFQTNLTIYQLPSFSKAIFGPATSKWYPYLNSQYKELSPVAATLSRVASDQLIFAPLNLFVFLNSMAILEGTSPKDKLESTYRRVLTKNYMVWPIAQAVNFTFVPLDSRVLYVSAVSIGMFHPFPVVQDVGIELIWGGGRIGWNCYLSYANSRRIAQSQ